MPTLNDILSDPDLLRKLGELGIKKSNLLKQFVDDLVALSNEEVEILMQSGQYDREAAVENANKGIDHASETVRFRAKHMVYQQHGIYGLQVY